MNEPNSSISQDSRAVPIVDSALPAMSVGARLTTAAAARQPERVVSIDVFRGMVMFLMLAELMHLNHLAAVFPGYPVLEWLRFHTSHVAWEGCSLHDLIQPGFTFLVGVAMPFSIASRLRQGGATWRLIAHAAWRSLMLIALGIVLRSLGSEQTYFTFEDTLTQIGLGYFVAFCVALLSRPYQMTALVLVLVGFWGLYAVLPAPPADFNYEAVGVPADWPHHYTGFASRWNKNSNVSWQFDTWFLNQFPRESVFEFNAGGYATLSFIPTLGTMLLGLLAGGCLRELPSYRQRMQTLVVAAAICLAVGWLCAWLQICPLVKRIWTPSFALYSGGWCLLWLATLHWLCDYQQWRRWAFPFVVIGANSILIYVMSWTVAEPIRDMLYRHLGTRPFAVLGAELVPTLSGAATMLILFSVLLWLYRRNAFLKI